MAYITFIIPTLGRKTLTRALKSIQLQKDADWKAIIVFDGIKCNLPEDYLIDKFQIVEINKSGKEIGNLSQAGQVRNHAFDLVDSEWIGFLDDDDYLRDNYITCLREEDTNDLELILFRMLTNKVTPSYGINTIQHNEAGISFAIKNSTIKRHNARFVNDTSEDYKFLKDLENKGVKYKVSEHITYDVCRNHPDKYQ